MFKIIEVVEKGDKPQPFDRENKNHIWKTFQKTSIVHHDQYTKS